MKNPFLDKFQDYSNTELLKIIKEREGYQPQAVIAAEEIIFTRQITDEEHREVEEFYEANTLAKQEREARLNSIRSRAGDLFYPLLHRTEKLETRRWLNIFLALVAIEYIHSLYKTIRGLITFFGCQHCSPDLNVFINGLNFFYVGLIFYLLYKRKKWGWILLFADNVVSALASVFEFIMYYASYHRFFRVHIESYLWTIFICAVFLSFLYRPEVASYFNVYEAKKKTFARRTSIICVAICMGIFVFVIWRNK